MIRKTTIALIGLAALMTGTAQASDFGFSFGFSRGRDVCYDRYAYAPAYRTVVYDPAPCYSYAPAYYAPAYYPAPVCYEPRTVVVRSRPVVYTRGYYYGYPRYGRSVHIRSYR